MKKGKVFGKKQIALSLMVVALAGVLKLYFYQVRFLASTRDVTHPVHHRKHVMRIALTRLL